MSHIIEEEGLEEYLINEVYKNKILFDVSHKECKDRGKTEVAWNTIAKVLQERSRRVIKGKNRKVGETGTRLVPEVERVIRVKPLKRSELLTLLRILMPAGSMKG